MTISNIDLNALLNESNVMELDSINVESYFRGVNSRLGQLSDILKRETSDPIIPYIEIIKDSIDCLVLKHALPKEDQLDFPLTIDPTESGFPTYKDFYLLQRDKERASKVLEVLPQRKTIIEDIRNEILKGRNQEHYQILLMRYNYFSRVKDTNVLKEFMVGNTKVRKEEDEKKFCTLDWTCIERATNLPVYYRMFFTQNSWTEVFNPSQNAKIQTILYQTQMGLTDIKSIASTINKEIDEISPKQIMKYVIGPFYNTHTKNKPNLNAILEDTKDQSILKFRVERVGSVNVKLVGGHLRKFFGLEIEKEVYGDVDIYDRRMIVPCGLKQIIGNYDENKRPCRVYGVTTGGDIIG
ncbi:hypothetical protein J4471_02775 [Candidatus Woesearchaeota archaeon]|nr:hypothetical protein [Candidatus Woesearchaeota archaeon]